MKAGSPGGDPAGVLDFDDVDGAVEWDPLFC